MCIVKLGNNSNTGTDITRFHGAQRRMISVDNFFVFLRLSFLLCCCYM